jgi:hypothetical protein
MEHADERNVSMLFRRILKIFEKEEPIPVDLRKCMSEHRVSMQFYDKSSGVCDGEKQCYKHIWLRDGEIVFDEATGSPHGKVIGLMASILSRPDPNGELELSTGVGMFLITRFLTVDTMLNNLTKKQPDLDLVPVNLPMPYNVNNIPHNLAVKKPAPYPHFVFEIAIANETMPKLINDEHHYFSPNTGTAATGIRLWMGVKVLEDNAPRLQHRWWAGWATRCPVTGGLLMSPESFPRLKPARLLSVPAPEVFHFDIATLFAPAPVPQNYPASIDIPLEQLRILIARHL